MEGRLDGLCTEIGPYGYRIDWGRITDFDAGEFISFKWQISAKREPIPDPDKASDVQVKFIPDGDSTTIEFEHFNFQKHGEGYDDYRKMLNSPQGWDFILERYKKYCDK